MVVLEFNGGLPNTSVEVYDLIYYVANVSNQWQNMYMASNDEVASGVSTTVFLGVVASIITETNESGQPIFKIVVDQPPTMNVPPAPSASDYIFFVKNTETELSTLKGYYSSVTLENNSKTAAELFAVSCNVIESSK